MPTMVSTKGRYALRALIDLALNQGDSYVPLMDTAARQGISEKYLEAIMSTLSRAKFIEGHRGKGGGYRLVRDPADYTLGQILRLVEGEIVPVACLEECENDCTRRATCRTYPMWKGLGDVVNSYFDGFTLQDLLDGPTEEGEDWPCGL
jgi:Rrf2 family protein